MTYTPNNAGSLSGTSRESRRLCVHGRGGFTEQHPIYELWMTLQRVNAELVIVLILK
jgi:hypothetical protein